MQPRIARMNQVGRARWEHFDHGADVGVRGIAPTMAGAFVQAALALTAVVTDPRRVRPLEVVEIRCEAPDGELLLVQWLNAVITEMAIRRLLFGSFEVQIDGHQLVARASGEPANLRLHEPAVEIKGATCTALAVRRTNEGWLAQTVVDV